MVLPMHIIQVQRCTLITGQMFPGTFGITTKSQKYYAMVRFVFGMFWLWVYATNIFPSNVLWQPRGFAIAMEATPKNIA